MSNIHKLNCSTFGWEIFKGCRLYVVQESLFCARTVLKNVIVYSKFCVLKSNLYISLADLWAQAEASVPDSSSTKFRRGEVHCFCIIRGVDTSALYLIKIFWWFKGEDQGIFRSSTSICTKVISRLLFCDYGI